jgi:ATP-dependent RNA helicase RhlE
LTRFDALSLHPALLAAVRAAGFETPTPIQAQAIPPILAGRDVLGCAQTGTGKTAAFVLPLAQRLAAGAAPGAGPRGIRALVLAPTRELATQIADDVATFGAPFGLRGTAIHGGVSDAPQRRALRQGVDVLVATPGRLEDLRAAGVVDLRRVEFLVLDEADRMLDAGFLPAVRRLLAALPRARQTLLFSATMPDEIRALARSVQRDAVEVRVAKVATPATRVEQAVFFVARPDKRRLLAHLLADPEVTRALVFTRTKRGADRVARYLREELESVDAIHGNRSQPQRERALEGFRRGATRVLVATDLAARGIDVEGISHVINFELPDDSESYVHRIGRTGRAAAAGVALSLCDDEERAQLARIERLIRAEIPVRREHPFATARAAEAPVRRAPPRPPRRAARPHAGRARRLAR